MFAELPKLFGKAFAIGFFLPAALLLLGLAGDSPWLWFCGKIY